MATMELYRRSTIGKCLTEALDEMVSSKVLPVDFAIKVLLQFDKSIKEALETRVNELITIKGHLHTYRNCDGVWTFILKDALLTTSNNQEHFGNVKIVACNAKIFESLY